MQLYWFALFNTERYLGTFNMYIRPSQLLQMQKFELQLHFRMLMSHMEHQYIMEKSGFEFSFLMEFFLK